MDRLPTEVLHNVFIQLELQDRIACTLVCRNWWRVLDEFSLLFRIDIADDEDLFERFLELIKQFPHRAKQVEELILCSTVPLDVNKQTLLNTFSNLRVLKVEHDSDYAQSYSNEPINNKQSTSKLRILHDSFHCEVALQILTSNLGGKLEQLKLRFGRIESISTRNILDQLKNLPVLKKLTLHALGLGVNDLENLHHYVPSIQTLGLYSISIVDSKIPASITPATCITTLEIFIESAASTRSHIQFYQYMTRKYRNVDNINYDDHSLSHYHDDDSRRIYLNGRLDFYKMIAPKKKTFHFRNVPADVNAFEIFDETKCQLEEIQVSNCQDSMFWNLCRSNQSRYIQRLAMVGSDIRFISGIKGMAALTELNLHFFMHHEPETIDIVDCLNACPATLKTFDLRCSEITAKAYLMEVNHLETLRISCNSFDSDLAEIISSSFPNLVELTLKGQIKESINIALDSPFFQRAEFRLSFVYPYGTTLKVPGPPQHYLYLGDGQFHLAEYRLISLLPVLTVTSCTAKRIDFSNGLQIFAI